jgi:hypothetical protein
MDFTAKLYITAARRINPKGQNEQNEQRRECSIRTAELTLPTTIYYIFGRTFPLYLTYIYT